MRKLLPVMMIFLLIVLSGCSSENGTGRVAETTKLAAYEPEAGQTTDIQEDKDSVRKEFEDFEKSLVLNQSAIVKQNASQAGKNTTVPPVNFTKQPGQKKSCPPCGDGDPCTRDSCSNETDYLCRHEGISPCCGKGLCEASESPESCIKDCPKLECTLTCPSCEILDNETCFCMNQTTCQPGDDCCPQGCNHATDADCPEPDACMEDSECDDNDACTQDSCTGSPRECSYSAITDCSSADSCCPEGCTNEQDADCSRSSAVFSEIYYNPIGNDPTHEWVEVYNNGTTPIDLTSWRFEELNGSHFINKVTQDVTLVPGSYAVIAENATQFLADYPEFTGLLLDSTYSLSNTGEVLILRTGKGGDISDTINYSSEWGADSNGFSLEKMDMNGPNDQANWKESTQDKGTPGKKNSVSP